MPKSRMLAWFGQLKLQVEGLSGCKQVKKALPQQLGLWMARTISFISGGSGMLWEGIG